MKVTFKLVGYDRETEDLVEKHVIPAKYLDFAKKVAGIHNDATALGGDTPLTPSQARDIAGTINVTIDVTRRDYFLEPYVEKAPVKHHAHA